MNKRSLAEAYGWYGAAAIVLAYALVSFKVIPADGYVYQMLNLTGAVGIIIVSIRKKAQQPAVLNTVWAIVAVAAIVGLLLKK
jgi:hypothetical protein